MFNEKVVYTSYTFALLAHKFGFDALLLLTDIEAVFREFGTGGQTAIARMTTGQAAGLDLPDGSKAPKVYAATSFVSGASVLHAWADWTRLLPC